MAHIVNTVLVESMKAAEWRYWVERMEWWRSSWRGMGVPPRVDVFTDEEIRLLGRVPTKRDCCKKRRRERLRESPRRPIVFPEPTPSPAQTRRLERGFRRDQAARANREAKRARWRALGIVNRSERR